MKSYVALILICMLALAGAACTAKRTSTGVVASAVSSPRNNASNLKVRAPRQSQPLARPETGVPQQPNAGPVSSTGRQVDSRASANQESLGGDAASFSNTPAVLPGGIAAEEPGSAQTQTKPDAATRGTSVWSLLRSPSDSPRANFLVWFVWVGIAVALILVAYLLSRRSGHKAGLGH